MTGVRQAVSSLNLQQCGIDIDLVGVHSLRAGGAMALKLASMDIVMTKKHGRWLLETFLKCIHEQMSSLGHGVSKAMAQPRDFFNIAGYEM